ncbi:hypothetical protein ROZALSC1DRAFT_28010 [Rozella allomycis CSF55]|uniref:Dynein regulatory complex subunit 7 n=1 Tax=Rozella allomycis (strain CSF55) TaxID=988480 RepID=A0A075AV78_ROZAC|nr:hypothetical protein O9G_001834 [Rozella allomycis CSF55]RKP20505.1 hypothetical protein ROZALSC1DRAFT_28010 [Rozella allomycis CSF55]|eukprot:EPZ34221.1 hypothetical protein O9G_001834 [Rozella allomycis CSF55]
MDREEQTEMNQGQSEHELLEQSTTPNMMADQQLQNEVNPEQKEIAESDPTEESLAVNPTALESTNEKVINKEEESELPLSKSQDEYFQMVKEVLTADPSKCNPSYSSNSQKEGEVLDIVENFVRQYKQLYPHRKDLFLIMKNEFNINKFVCSTIRPTSLPYKDLYDYRECAKFVADYLSYEPLDPPYDLPEKLPSPTFTLKVQSGNCFDYSVLLASLLRGVGYDAYVVSGYATKDITLIDDSKIFENVRDEVSSRLYANIWDESKDLETFLEDKNDNKENLSANKYKLKPPKQLKSDFIVKQNEKLSKIRKEQEEKQLREREEELARQKSLREQDDLRGLRIHCWVLLLAGKREIAESLFIEPTTGKTYPLDHSAYLGVESVFSNLNYWVNMQVCIDGLKGVSFDLGDNTKWEFLFLENSQPGITFNTNLRSKENEANMSDDEDENNLVSNEVDLPPSWVDPLEIPQERYEARCPTGRKVAYYQNAITETYGDYFRKDGMIFRVIRFSDEEKKKKSVIEEFFSKRKDKLVKRQRNMETMEIIEFFERGRLHALRRQVIMNSKMKEMHFYASARHDGLLKRIETPRKTIEHFQDRDDLLIYRSVTFEENPETNSRGEMIKITEKFSQKPDASPLENIYKKSFFLKEEKIRVSFYLQKDKIVRSYIDVRKPPTEQNQKLNINDLVTFYDIDPYAVPPKKQYLYSLILQLIKAEQQCLLAVHLAEKELQEIIESRNSEEKDVQLTISVYDRIRGKNDQTLFDSNHRLSLKKDKEDPFHIQGPNKLDYLSPFLVSYNTSSLTKDDAMAVKDSALKSLKERLIEKANIIQKRLDEETNALQKAQQSYQKNQDNMSLEETESYMSFCKESMFRIQILEKRLAKHKESAPERYVNLDKKLKNDPRLISLVN